VLALARPGAGEGRTGCLAAAGDSVGRALARAAAGWPGDAAPLAWLPVAGRWSRAAEEASADAPGRIALWRGASHVADDARAVGLAYARLARPVGLTLLEVDAHGEFGAFAEPLPLRATLLDPATAATVAAVDADDDGAPWLAATLAALVDSARLVAVLPPGATATEAAPPGSAFAAVLAHHPGPVTCHVVG
jgi:hypothetical protein